MDDQRTSKKRKIFLETLVKCLMDLLDLSAEGRNGKKNNSVLQRPKDPKKSTLKLI